VEVTCSVIRDVVSSSSQESRRSGIASGKKRVRNVVSSMHERKLTAPDTLNIRARRLWKKPHQNRPRALNRSNPYRRFTDTPNRLAAMPFIGQARVDLAPSLRMFPVGNYLIFFQPIQDGVEVIRVLHGKRNITGRFF
jgi:toxin ParE1/3/4